MMMDLAVSTLAQGLMWSILAIGVFLSFRILDVPDMTCEGSFPLGAAVAATMMTSGFSPASGIAGGIAGGIAAGVITGLLYTKLKIPAILSGILSMIAIYSVNLHIMGKANIPLLRVDTAFTQVSQMFHMNMVYSSFSFSLVLAVLVGLFMYWFFGTELGTAIRATGFNEQMMRAQGVNTDNMIIIGLLISNGLIGLCGAVVAQSNGFADVGMGIGTIVIGLASVIIGEVLWGTGSFKMALVSVIAGSVLYRIVIAAVLYLGMPPNDLKLFTAVLVAAALAMPLLKSHLDIRKEVQ